MFVRQARKLHVISVLPRKGENSVRIFIALLVSVSTLGLTGDSASQATGGSMVQAASRSGQPANRWRYVWHNDRWWYWTPSEHWSYFDGRRWQSYDPRRPLSGALSAGYRKAPAFESPPAAPPQPPRTWSAEGVERETGLANSYYLEGGAASAGGMPLGGESLPVLGGPSPTPAVRSSIGTGTSPPSTGGGAFGGPKGSSLGAGSAVGGASSPQ